MQLQTPERVSFGQLEGSALKEKTDYTVQQKKDYINKVQ